MRSLDAIHLASALEFTYFARGLAARVACSSSASLAGSLRASLAFVLDLGELSIVTLDDRIRANASLLGFPVLPPDAA